MNAARAPALIAVIALAAACVTDRPKPGLHYRGAPVGDNAPAPAARDAAPELPAGPVAAPVVDSTFNSSIQAEVLPLGSVGYDGQVLPLVSPDGRFLASEEGQTPTWPTLLAAPGAAMPLATRVVAYDIAQNPARTVNFTHPLPKGLVLGRAADDTGFLVEAPQPDGARWIGRVEWLSGTLTWLVRNGRVNAHAVFTPAGSLVYIARDISAETGVLVVRATDGTETLSSGDGSSHLFPIASPEPGIVCSLSSTAAGLEVLAWSLDCGPANDAAIGPERLGSIVARGLVCRGDSAIAYQIVAPAPQVLPRRANDAWRGERPAIFHPQFGRMAEFNRFTGGFVLLPERSIAAARSSGTTAEGWFVTTPDGLLFSPDVARERDNPGRRTHVQNARVDPVPYVPRQTNNPERPLVLLGPSKRRPDRLLVVVLRFSGAAAPDS